MEVFVLFATFLVLLIIRVNIGFSIGIAVVIAMILFTNMPLNSVAQQSIEGINSFTLLAIPFFILAGNIMAKGGLAKRLMNFASELVGYFTGGLAVVATITAGFFGAMSGSAVATTSAIGSFMIPEMEEKGYDRAYSAVAVASASAVGVIIPPSIPYVIYGVVVGASISELFLAGLIPGILIVVALAITNIITARRKGYQGTGIKPSFKRIAIAFKDAFWALLTPVVILGGIYSGLFTPTEASVVAVVYSLLVSIFIYREMNLRELYDSMLNTINVNGATTYMIGISTAFATYLTLEHIPQQLANTILNISSDAVVILLLMNLLLLIIGTVIDNIPATIILSPIFLPIVTEFGMHPVHLGIIITLNLAIGFFTPPYGINLFVASAISGLSLEKLWKHVGPPLVACLVVLLLVTFIPSLSMGVVELLK